MLSNKTKILVIGTASLGHSIVSELNSDSYDIELVDGLQNLHDDIIKEVSQAYVNTKPLHLNDYKRNPRRQSKGERKRNKKDRWR